MARFDGIPVDQPVSKPRFGGGELVEVPPVASAQQPAAPAPSRERGWFDSVMDLASGPRPLQGNTVEELRDDYQSRSPALRATLGAGRFVDSNIRGIAQLTGTADQLADDKAKIPYQTFDKVAEGDLATGIGRYVPELAAIAIPSSKLAALPRLGQRLAAGAGLGAATGGLKEADSTQQRLTNVGVGAGLGAAGEGVATGLRAIARPVSEGVASLYNSAKKFGVELTPAQLTNSQFMRRAQNLLQSMPLSGARQAWERQVDQFNTAVSREFGENAPKITPDIFAKAKSRIGAEFDALSTRSTLNVTDGLLDRLGTIQQEAAAFADEGTVRAVSSAIDRVLRQSTDGKMPGPAYKSLDSQLGKIMAGGGEKSAFVAEVRDAIREAMDESISPALREAWRTARSQYRALKTVEPLVAKSADGSISPGQLMGRVTANRAGKASMAAGRGGNLGELARVGQAMKAPSSSGTVENMLAAQSFNPVAWPVMGIRALMGATAGRAGNSSLLASLLGNQQTRVAATNGLASLARPGAIAAAPVVTPEVRKPSRRDDSR
ncbi:hypothetical protein D3C81_170350 [compost metagenome]